MDMARSTGPAPSLETFDALKRRFVRQNREIAKANSTQSIRIRNLETEVSRLQSENIDLRERIISLQYEVGKRPGRSMWDDMVTVKGKLEAKLIELGGLVQELGKVQPAAETYQSPKQRSIDRISPKISPDQKTWKSAYPLSDVAGGGEGRLPPIVEGKYFPRKTLDAEEILRESDEQANVTDSPDIGPPPIAHFEEGDPVDYDAAREIAPVHTQDECEQQGLFANLETRKRRRETSKIVQSKSHWQADSKPSQPVGFTDLSKSLVQPLMLGAKRKISVKEFEGIEQENISENEGLEFSRRHVLADWNKNALLASKILKPDSLDDQKFPQEVVKRATQGKVKESTPVTTTISRKALGPKSVNSDPISPVKLSKFSKAEKASTLKDEISKKAISRSRFKDKQLTKPIHGPKDLEPIKVTSLAKKIDPETPAPLVRDQMSPVSSKPSAPRPDSRDTPPPTDLKSEVSNAGAFGAAARATRRPRGASISYAEPNLKGKMRRPTNNLIDAVGSTGDRPQHLLTVTIEDKTSEPECATAKQDPIVKKEYDPNAINPWKISSIERSQNQLDGRAEPVSPLENKASAMPALLPTSMVTDRRRRTVGLQRNEDVATEQVNNHPGAASAIAALSAGSQKYRRQDDESRRKAEQPEASNIYDFSQSSPQAAAEDDGCSNNISKTLDVPPLRGVRRPFAMLAAAEESSAAEVGSGGTVASAITAKRRERRRESMVGGAKEGGAGELKIARSAVGLGHGGGEDVVAAAARLGRTERAASRRRSMML